MSEMIDLKQALVADHITGLEREGAALRAERFRDHVREHATAPHEAAGHPIDLPGRRVRLGRWLVSVGEAIAGPADPCRDGNERMPHAA